MGKKPRGGASKFGLHKAKKQTSETTDNRTYKRANKLVNFAHCLICMGPCWAAGPYRSNKFKRNCGRKPRYKDKRKTWGRLKEV
jgi:hypothetical protein